MAMKSILSVLALAFTLPMMASAPASAASSKKAEPSVAETPFGTLDDGGKVTLYTLTNPSGAEVRIINYGARRRIAEGSGSSGKAP